MMPKWQNGSSWLLTRGVFVQGYIALRGVECRGSPKYGYISCTYSKFWTLSCFSVTWQVPVSTMMWPSKLLMTLFYKNTLLSFERQKPQLNRFAICLWPFVSCFRVEIEIKNTLSHLKAQTFSHSVSKYGRMLFLVPPLTHCMSQWGPIPGSLSLT